MRLEQTSIHGRWRLKNRAIPPSAVDLVLTYGREVHKHGATRVFLDGSSRREIARHEGKPLLREMGHKLDIFVVISTNGTLITAAYRTGRMKH